MDTEIVLDPDVLSYKPRSLSSSVKMFTAPGIGTVAVILGKMTGCSLKMTLKGALDNDYLFLLNIHSVEWPIHLLSHKGP